jgi:hypothetical protein
MGELVKDQPAEMMRLSADIGLVSLQQLIERFEEMRGKTLLEAKWQAFFNDNPFVLSLAFSTPTTTSRKTCLSVELLLQRWPGS